MKESRRRSSIDEARASLRERLEERTDLELKAMVSVDRDTYEPESVQVAEEILESRGIGAPTEEAYLSAKRLYEKENKAALDRIKVPGRRVTVRGIVMTSLLKLIGISLKD